MNHSLLMLINNKWVKKGVNSKIVKTNSVMVVLADVFGITALFIRGLGKIEHIVLNIFLLVPFIVGIIVFITRLHYKNKSYKMHKKK